LRALCSFSGAAMTPLIKALLQGSDSDWSVGGAGKDVGRGAIDGFCNAVGPAEMGKVAGIGEAAAKSATKEVAKDLGTSALKEGGKVLGKGLTHAVRKAGGHDQK